MKEVKTSTLIEIVCLCIPILAFVNAFIMKDAVIMFWSFYTIIWVSVARYRGWKLYKK